ncbi:MAG TPA: AAA domain-containing protein [Myxococcaceae bacterium]|nr:AAA domain-containing protein [Myxococcaceae bacterium]
MAAAPLGPEHFELLRQLLVLERRSEEQRLASERSQLTQGEREARGLSAGDLEAIDEDVGLGGRFLVTLARAGGVPWRNPFGPGDVVEARPRRAEVAPPERALVVRGGRDRAQLAFDRPPPDFVRSGRLVLDLVADDVTFGRTDTAVVEVAAGDRGAPRRRRDVLLGKESPRFEPEHPPEGIEPLNPEQRSAVEHALAARDLFCVHGPPGTGKSTVLAAVARNAVARHGRILGTAASNAAVDHLVELCLAEGLRVVRVGHPARVSPRLVEHTLDVRVEQHPDRALARQLFDDAFELLGHARKQRQRGRSRERFANARSAQAEARALMDDARALERKAVRDVLEGADVLCATLTALGGAPLSSLRFPLALVDEATQATEPLTLLAFLRAERVVLAGDHRQLPPTILSQEAAAGGLATSLFERLLALHGEPVRQMLREQYRMNAELMELPSRAFYGGELRAHPSVADRTLSTVLPGTSLDAPPLLFLDSAGKGWEEVAPEGSESLENPGEAEVVLARARALLAAGLLPGQIAVITPYRAQAARMGPLLEPLGIEVDTVDAFQGREAEAVLVSCVRSNTEGRLGFLTDLRRMNVALTRAKVHTFVVGDSATLGGHPFYARLIERAQSLGGYRSAWEWTEPKDAAKFA